VYLEVLKCGAGEGRRRLYGTKKSITKSRGEKENATHKRKKAKWICHFLSRKYHLNTLLEERGGTRRQGRRLKQLVDDLEENQNIGN